MRMKLRVKLRVSGHETSGVWGGNIGLVETELWGGGHGALSEWAWNFW